MNGDCCCPFCGCDCVMFEDRFCVQCGKRMLMEVVVDKRVLDGFKRRALKAYPCEHYEILLGVIRDGRATVYSFQDADHAGTPVSVVVDADSTYDEEQDEYRHRIIGTIHSHTNGVCFPSTDDFDSMREEGEPLMGLCAIRKTAQRRFVAFSFHNAEGMPLQLTISEGK